MSDKESAQVAAQGSLGATIATKIAEGLSAVGLIPASATADVARKIEDGTVSQRDWQDWVAPMASRS